MFDLILIAVIIAGLGFLVAVGLDDSGRHEPNPRDLAVTWIVVAALVVALSRRPTP
jgi:hypothetical protein